MQIKLEAGESIEIVTPEGKVVVGSNKFAKKLFVELHGEHGEFAPEGSLAKEGVRHFVFPATDTKDKAC